MKYFLLSAFSSSLLLLGIGLIYWQTGLTRCSSLQELLTTITNSAPGNDKTDILQNTELLPELSNNAVSDLTIWLGLWLIGLALLWKLA